jgi:hypothetical protein
MNAAQLEHWQQLMAQVDQVLTGLHLTLGDWETVEGWLSGAIAQRNFSEPEGGQDE